MPYSFHHLLVGVIHSPIPMHLSSFELTLIDFTIIPFKHSIPVHFTIFEGAFINTSLGYHLSRTNLQVAWKKPLVMSLSAILKAKDSFPFHVPISKRPFIDFSIFPSKYCVVIFLHTVHKFTGVAWVVRVIFSTLSVGLIVSPLSRILEASISGYKFAWALELTVLYFSSFEWAIGVEKYSVRAFNFTKMKWALKIRSVIKIELAKPLGFTGLPSSFIVSIVFIDEMHRKFNTWGIWGTQRTYVKMNSLEVSYFFLDSSTRWNSLGLWFIFLA